MTRITEMHKPWMIGPEYRETYAALEPEFAPLRRPIRKLVASETAQPETSPIAVGTQSAKSDPLNYRPAPKRRR
jgi:hypothetical protein